MDDLITTAFPGECRVCERPLLRAGMAPVCGVCLERVQPQSDVLCRVCGEALGMESERFAEGFGEDGRVCTPCRRVAPGFARAVAYAVYAEEMRELVHLLKYERVRGLERPLGAMLAGAVELLGEEIAGGGEMLVVAVPLFGRKKRGRGSNHAELLANAAVRELKRRRPEWKLRAAHALLRRVRETKSQFGLTPRDRRANVRGAFAVRDGAAVAGREVLLIDDIYTTGATARACALALRGAGAERVLVATLARAQTESVAMWTGEVATATGFGSPPPADSAGGALVSQRSGEVFG